MHNMRLIDHQTIECIKMTQKLTFGFDNKQHVLKKPSRLNCWLNLRRFHLIVYVLIMIKKISSTSNSLLAGVIYVGYVSKPATNNKI